MSKRPLKRIYFDTNPLYRWPHMPSDIPSLLGVANWVGAGLYVPKIVEDELEGQYVRSIEGSYGKLRADLKELTKLCRHVMTPDITGSAPTQDEVRAAFRVRSEQLKAHFKISTIPIQEIGLERLLEMAINRDEPFEQIEISKTKHVVVGLQDTAILFAIIKHMQTAEGDRCAFLTNDDVFHRVGTRSILKAAGVELEMFKKTSDLFDDLFEHVMDAIRNEWNAEMNKIEVTLNEEKERLAPEILGLITTADIGRGIWKRTLEIKSFRITEFTQVKTELPESEHRPPNAEKYKRPEGSEVLISARVSTESDVRAESLNFVGLFTGDYTKEETSNTVEDLKVKDTLDVSLKGVVQGDKVGNFKVVTAEPAR
jgi:hypothetical protein